MNLLSCLVVGGLGVLAGMGIQKDQMERSELLKERFAKNRENEAPYKLEPATPKVPKFQDPPRGYNLFQDPPAEPKKPVLPNMPDMLIGTNLPRPQWIGNPPIPKVFSTPEPQTGSEEDLKKIMEDLIKECGGDAGKLDQAAQKLGYAFTWLTRLRNLDINGIQKAVHEINNEQIGRLNKLISCTEAAGRAESSGGRSEPKITAGEIAGSVTVKDDKDGKACLSGPILAFGKPTANNRTYNLLSENESANTGDFAPRDHSRIYVTDADGKVTNDSGSLDKEEK